MELSVTQNKIEITKGSLVNQGEYKATPLKFEFVKSYDGLVKYAVFTYDPLGNLEAETFYTPTGELIEVISHAEKAE